MARGIRRRERKGIVLDEVREKKAREFREKLGSYQNILGSKGLAESTMRSVYGKMAEAYEGLAELDRDYHAWMAAGDAWILAGNTRRAGRDYDRYIHSHADFLVQRARSLRAQREGGLAGKTAAAVIAMGAFLLSIIFAFNSFTGYAIAGEVNTTLNWTSLLFFLLGLVLAYYLLWRK